MTQHTAATTAQLLAALKVAQSGDVIDLAGTIIKPKLSGFKFEGLGVTIRGGTISGYTPVFDSSGLTFDGVVFMQPADGVLVKLLRAKAIRFVGCDFSALSPVKTSGLGLDACVDVTAESCAFHDLGGAVSHIRCDGLTLTHCDVRRMGSDGFIGQDVDNLAITENRFTDFLYIGAVHPDAIQLWGTRGSAAGEPSNRNVTIAGNRITRGVGKAVQGIFVTPEAGGTENLVIKGNVCVGVQWNALRASGARSGEITGNVVLAFAEKDGFAARIYLGSNAPGVRVSGNVANAIILLAGAQPLAEGANMIVPPIAANDVLTLAVWDAARMAA